MCPERGFVSVIHQDSADKYSLVANVTNGPCAKTSLLLPFMHRYYIAASPEILRPIAQLLIFETNPTDSCMSARNAHGVSANSSIWTEIVLQRASYFTSTLSGNDSCCSCSRKS